MNKNTLWIKLKGLPSKQGFLTQNVTTYLKNPLGILFQKKKSTFDWFWPTVQSDSNNITVGSVEGVQHHQQ